MPNHLTLLIFFYHSKTTKLAIACTAIFVLEDFRHCWKNQNLIYVKLLKQWHTHSMWFYPFVVAICVVTSQFSSWLLHSGLIYMRCVVTLSTKKQKNPWPRGNPEKKENTLKFVGFVLNAPISKFQSKCCWKSWLNWENVHFVASCKFFTKKRQLNVTLLSSVFRNEINSPFVQIIIWNIK